MERVGLRVALAFAEIELATRNVSGSPGGGSAACTSGSVVLGNCDRNSRRPTAIASRRFSPWSAKNRNGADEANSCPWNSIGVAGASSVSAVSAR